MQRESCELPIGESTFEVPPEVANHVNDLRTGVLGSVCLIGEATRIGNEAVDVLEELVNAAHFMTAGQLVRCKELIRQRNGIRAAALQRRAGEG